jgi:hypothetical protein
MTRSPRSHRERRSAAIFATRGGQRLDARLDLVGHRLGIEIGQPVGAAATQFGDQRAELIVLAAKTDHQYRAGIRVLGQGGQKLAGPAQVISQLGAAKGMSEGEDAVGESRKSGLRQFGDAAHGLGYAPDRAQYPNFVAYPDLSVCTSIAHEFASWRNHGRPHRRLAVRILIVPGKIGVQIMGMHMFTDIDGRKRMPDGVTILRHHLARLVWPQCNLVSPWRIRADLNDAACERHLFAGQQVAQAHGHRIGVMHLQQAHVRTPLTRSRRGLRIWMTRSAMK